jgi:hypothetical protein
VGSAIPCIVIRVIQKEVRLSYSFVNLECEVLACPGDLGYHHCGVINFI